MGAVAFKSRGPDSTPAKSGGLVVSASFRPALVALVPYSSNPAVPTEVSRESAEVRGSNPRLGEEAAVERAEHARHDRERRMATAPTPSLAPQARRACVGSCVKELQCLFHERLVVLEDTPMPGILIEDELGVWKAARHVNRSEEHTSELQSRFDLVCRLLL